MIYVLHGADTYRSREKLRELIGEFRNSAGANFDFHRFDAEENGLKEIRQALETASLFSRKKIVVIEHMASVIETEELPGLLKPAKYDKETIVFLWEGEADAKTKKMLSAAEAYAEKIQEFKLLTPKERERWIEERAEKMHIKISREELAALVSGGSDLWKTANELEKIAVGKSGKISVDGHSLNIFQLGDSFFSAPRRAITVLLGLLDAGQDEFGLFSYLANQTRTLALVQSYLGRAQAVPATLGIHPFVIKKTTALARHLPWNFAAQRLKTFFEEDWKNKTGILKPKESLLLMIVAGKETRPN